MKNYIVTFYWQQDLNSHSAVSIRTELELLSPDKWVQIFPNQVAIQSDLSIDEIYALLQPVAKDIRISIFEFSNYFVNEQHFLDFLDKNAY